MNEITLVKDVLQGLKTRLKITKRHLWVLGLAFLIVWAIVCIFLPSTKPAHAGDFLEWQNFAEVNGKIEISFTASSTASAVSITDADAGQFPRAVFYNPLTSCTAYTTTTCSLNFADLKWVSSGNDIAIAHNVSGITLAEINAGPFGSGFLDGRCLNYFGGLATWEGGSSSGNALSVNSFCWGDESRVPTTPTGASFTITSPASGTTATTSFDVVGSYDLKGQSWDRLVIYFEDWNASSTCPLYSDSDYQTQYDLYFHNQSQAYFSTLFNSTTTGIAMTSISDLPAGNYHCTKCYFFNETTRDLSNEVCQNYAVIVPSTIPPTTPNFYTAQSWPNFYTDHADKWATSTELFTYLAEKTAPVLLWVGNFTADFKNLFNNASSSAVGQEIGQAIPTARGYLTIVNYYFAGIPISEIFIFYLLTALVIIVLKIVLMIWHFFRG